MKNLLFHKGIKYFASLFLIFIFAGCSGRNYTYSPNYQRNFEIPQNVKINNSKNMHKATMRPYTVDGKTYYPTTVSIGNTFSGIASWYGRDFHGKRTSNGEFYNMYSMTAASKILPMNTVVKVTNLQNFRSAIVRINDRGPFVRTRIIDLSYAAASRLDIVSNGTAPVRLEVIGFGGVINTGKTRIKSIRMSNFLVQIGAFRKESGAQRFANQNTNVLSRYKSIVKEYSYEGYPLYRVYLSGFGSENEARDFISKGLFDGSFIVGN